MTDIGRREFLARTVVPSSVLAIGAVPASALARSLTRGRSLLADSHVDVLIGEPIATIAPEIYGHFVEHLGGVVYDGIWVGEQSKIPNVGGIRKALIDALRPLRPAVVRWPGGCFADAYDWRDGVGPREKRPRRTNVWADDERLRALGNIPARFEPNSFGTNEFMRFVRAVGAQPYFGANLRTQPASVFHQWVEYCNSPVGSTTLAELRAQGGDPEPFGVRYWGVGNESWGCGGNFTPDEYAAEYRRFSTWAVQEHGVPLHFIGAGPSGGDYEWTRRFFDQVNRRGDLGRMWGWALHHYCSAPNGEAVAFDNTAWYELLASADKMESLITGHWQVMREADRDHHVKLVVDEWGAWHKQTTNVDPSHLFGQQSTVRDALVAGLTLDTFNRHADKVAMANVAQLVNTIQSLFLAHDEQFLVTPTYHVFAMYTPHQGGQSLRTLISAPRLAYTDSEKKERTLWGMAGSASRKDGVVTLTLTNPHLTQPRDTEIVLRGGSVRSISAMTLSHTDVHAHNTFDAPRTVTPETTAVPTVGNAIVHRLPPASVTRLQFVLGA